MKTIIENILHPTDFSEGSAVAFNHALKLALLARSGLVLLHVAPDPGSPSWSDFPGIRETLERWGLLPTDSPRHAVQLLGIEVQKKIAVGNDPVSAVMRHLDEQPAEMIILATHQRRGAIPWLSNSVAEPIARRATQMTLFISGNTEGFVSSDDGAVSLNNVLIPVAMTPHPQPAVDAAARLVETLGCTDGTFTLLHVGSASAMPAAKHPDVSGWTWNTDVREGEVIQTILDASNDLGADLIVMATDGRDGFLDGLRGSHSERILRQVGVPILTVPVGSVVHDAIR